MSSELDKSIMKEHHKARSSIELEMGLLLYKTVGDATYSLSPTTYSMKTIPR
jgi:hypothetical protein